MKKFLRTAVPVVFWLVAWQAVSMLIKKEVVLPSPVSTVSALIGLLGDAYFYKSVLLSFLRMTAGFLAGMLLGCVLGAAEYFFPVVRYLMRPILTVIKATPVVSFIILLFMWVNRNYIPTFASVLMILPIVAANMYSGLSESNRDLLEAAKAFKMKKGAVFGNIYLPSALPSLAASADSCYGIAWKAGAAAEVICNPKYGIGAGMYNSKIYLEMPSLFAWTLVIIVISVICEGAVGLAVRSLKSKRRKYNAGA